MSTLPLSSGLLRCPVGSPIAARAGLDRLLKLGAIVGAHLLLAWALLQSHGVRQALQKAQPLMVALLADARPALPDAALPATAPAQPKPLPMPPLLPPPEITVASAQAPPPPAPLLTAQVPVLPPMQAPAAPAAIVAAPATDPRPPVATPAEPRAVAAGQIRYRVAPAIEVPMASRRLGESGTVLLRVLVDLQGLPRRISLHRSSGFARLDEQALAAMRAARFQPLVEGGTAYEWQVIAPLQYDID